MRNFSDNWWTTENRVSTELRFLQEVPSNFSFNIKLKGGRRIYNVLSDPQSFSAPFFYNELLSWSPFFTVCSCIVITPRSQLLFPESSDPGRCGRRIWDISRDFTFSCLGSPPEFLSPCLCRTAVILSLNQRNRRQIRSRNSRCLSSLKVRSDLSDFSSLHLTYRLRFASAVIGLSRLSRLLLWGLYPKGAMTTSPLERPRRFMKLMTENSQQSINFGGVTITFKS